MAKTKEQKRKEAQERAVSNMAGRADDLLWWMCQHHTELALDSWSKWTVDTLRSKIVGFHNHLRDCGLPFGDGALFIVDGRNYRHVKYGADALYYRNAPRKCLYCLQPKGQYHQAPCANVQSGRVSEVDAIYIDERLYWKWN